jgi:hypothetical protein
MKKITIKGNNNCISIFLNEIKIYDFFLSKKIYINETLTCKSLIYLNILNQLADFGLIKRFIPLKFYEYKKRKSNDI